MSELVEQGNVAHQNISHGYNDRVTIGWQYCIRGKEEVVWWKIIIVPVYPIVKKGDMDPVCTIAEKVGMDPVHATAEEVGMDPVLHYS